MPVTKGNQLYRRILGILERHLGQAAGSFLDRQLNFISRMPDNLSADDLPALAEKVRSNSIMLVGRMRADEMYNKIMGIYHAKKDN